MPIIEKTGDVEDYVEYVVNTLLELKGLYHSIGVLPYGIEWLIVDKFVKDELTRNILCDRLGDRMALIDEYARNRVIRAENRIIKNQLEAGFNAELIAKTVEVPLSRVRDIERDLKVKK